MKFKVIKGDNLSDFEKKVNDFIKNVGAVLDIRYEEGGFGWVAYILYEDVHYKNPWAADAVDNEYIPL